MYKRHAIALLITIFFIMAISVILGLSLKQIKDTKDEVIQEKFILQTSVLMDDILNILKKSQDLDLIVKDNSKDALFIFLSEVSFIPFESSGVNVMIEISSARSKFNVNTLVNAGGKLEQKRVYALINYFSTFNVNNSYVDMLVDSISKTEEDIYYNSDIFNENPNLFRDYISSSAHLDEINNYYMKSNNDNSLSQIDFDDLFYYSINKNSKIDLNYATVQTWRLLLGCDEARAEQLNAGGGSYITIENLLLSDEEKLLLSNFSVSYYEPFLDVLVEIIEGDVSSKVRFEYDMKNKKGSNYIYEI